MNLPAVIADLGEQLRGGGEVVPDPSLFCDADVFAAERERIFTRPLIAVDHQSRLAEDGRYFRCDGAPRPIILAREPGGRLHAMRNVCIHAGYPVCDAEEGSAERLICPYHGWEYALDGRLVEPDLSSRIDPSRLRLTTYPVNVRNGLIIIDLSGGTEAVEQDTRPVPAWLVAAGVARRELHTTTWNWKFLRHYLWSSPNLFFDDPPDSRLEFGPLSLMIAQSQRAVLLRIIPKFAEQTDFQVIEMVADSTSQRSDSAAAPDAVSNWLRQADTSSSWFDRHFAEWYWSLMSTAE
jgi:nitrite reductase/ring-hydroxylating ferredoxin subunit